LRLELEDLDRRATGHADPPDAAARCGVVLANAEELTHAFRRCLRHAHERTAEDVPVELHEPAEVGHRDADVTERPDLHARSGTAGASAPTSFRPRISRRR